MAKNIKSSPQLNEGKKKQEKSIQKRKSCPLPSQKEKGKKWTLLENATFKDSMQCVLPASVGQGPWETLNYTVKMIAEAEIVNMWAVKAVYLNSGHFSFICLLMCCVHGCFGSGEKFQCY